MSDNYTTAPFPECVKRYADLGFKLVAWHGGNPVCKFPKLQGWGLEPLDPSTLNGEDMIGLNHGLSHTVVIDGDDLPLTRKVFGEIGLDVDAMPGNPPSYYGNPARLKWIYRLPEGFTPPGVKQLAGNVDGEYTTVFELRGCPEGKQAQDVLPPSRHPTGSAYEWIKPLVAYDQLPMLPADLADLWLRWDKVKYQLGAMAGFDIPAAKPFKSAPTTSVPQTSVIEAFNDANRIKDIIERHGYQPIAGKWLAPSSTTGDPGISIDTIEGKERLYSHHGTDPLSASAHGGHALDAFNVYQILEHGDEKSAVKAAASELGMHRASSVQGAIRTDESPLFTYKPINPGFINTVDPARGWIYGTMLMRNNISLLAGRGGAAKSLLSLCIGVSIASGHDFLGLHKGPLKPRKVLLINNEDDSLELKRRLKAILFKYSDVLDVDRVCENLDMINPGDQLGEGCLKIATLKADGRAVEPTEQYGRLLAYMQERGHEVAILDPLVSLSHANENDNIQMEAVMSLVRGVARRTGAAVALIHHTNKGGSDEDADGAARGASAIVNAVRANFLLSKMSKDVAKKASIDDDQRSRYIQLTHGKENYAASPDAGGWLYLESVPLSARDEDGQIITEYVGVPEPTEVTIDAGGADTLSAKDIADSFEPIVSVEAVDNRVQFSHIKAKLIDQCGVGATVITERAGMLPTSQDRAVTITSWGKRVNYWTERAGTGKTGALIICRQNWA